MAASAILEDKEWESENGFIRGWSAHVYHMKTAATPFKKLHEEGRSLPAGTLDPTNFPIKIEVPCGAITEEGTRRNIRTIIEYCEGWLSGRGAKGINSMEGKSEESPALMEDLATARISIAQTAQRIIHSVMSEDTGRTHDSQIVSEIANRELEDILNIRRLDQGAFSAELENRYKLAHKITNIWIENYTKLEFRSLGSYSREYWAQAPR
jgi:malate synthase